MSDPAKPAKPNWPVVIGILSLSYGATRCVFYRPSADATTVSVFFNVGVMVTMLGGGLALTLRMLWSIRILVIGSWLGVLHMVHTLITVFAALGGPPTIPLILGILTLMVPLHGWPVFLLLWFRRYTLGNSEGQNGSDSLAN